MVAFQNSIILFGGIGCQKNLTWAKITVSTKQQISVSLPDPFQKVKEEKESTIINYLDNASFYGHSMKSYKDYAFVYGGVNRNILNDILIMNLKNMKIKRGISAPFRRK